MTIEQTGLFGDSFKPEKYTPAELAALTGEPVKKPTNEPEKQKTMFDYLDDDPDQKTMF